MDMGRDFALVLGHGTSALMRGHGSTVVGNFLREALFTAVHLEINADLQLKLRQLGTTKFLTRGEIEQVAALFRAGRAGEGFDGAWQYWRRRAAVPFRNEASSPQVTQGRR
jgi:ribulose-5-phosphate 4-epimerase/fuculose-1-phosphate aldolase